MYSTIKQYNILHYYIIEYNNIIRALGHWSMHIGWEQWVVHCGQCEPRGKQKSHQKSTPHKSSWIFRIILPMEFHFCNFWCEIFCPESWSMGAGGRRRSTGAAHTASRRPRGPWLRTNGVNTNGGSLQKQCILTDWGKRYAQLIDVDSRWQIGAQKVPL